MARLGLNRRKSTGRNYVAERTIADPRVRAAWKARKRELERKRRAAAALGDAKIAERLAVCWVRDCGNSVTGDWMGCCSSECYYAMLRELERQDEVKKARLLGVPVAEYRKQQQR